MKDANLCECNKCGTTLLDENPQIGANLYDLSKVQYENMLFIDPSHYNFDTREGDAGYWACPRCETDSYLKDLRFEEITTHIFKRGENNQHLITYWDNEVSAAFSLDKSYIEKVDSFQHPYTEETIIFDNYKYVF